MIPRGTTPNQIFTVDADITQAEVVYLTYKQGNMTVLEKEKEELTITKDTVSFRMTQEESLLFERNGEISMQIRARFSDGTAIKSNIVKTSSDHLLKEGVI